MLHVPHRIIAVCVSPPVAGSLVLVLNGRTIPTDVRLTVFPPFRHWDKFGYLTGYSQVTRSIPGVVIISLLLTDAEGCVCIDNSSIQTSMSMSLTLLDTA